MLGVYTVSTYFCYTKAILMRRKLRNNSRTTIPVINMYEVINVVCYERYEQVYYPSGLFRLVCY